MQKLKIPFEEVRNADGTGLDIHKLVARASSPWGIYALGGVAGLCSRLGLNVSGSVLYSAAVCETTDDVTEVFRQLDAAITQAIDADDAEQERGKQNVDSAPKV